ncbi:MAG: amidohydrolase family protein [Rhodobacteraceae bacterium]|nr:amidohydrolase family protein [Paracoccaceae bacterium]
MRSPAPIDIHAHFYPEAYLRLVAEEGDRHGIGCVWNEGELPVIDIGAVSMPIERRYYDLQARLESMDRQGVSVHALSLTQPMVYWAPATLAKRLSELFNDACMDAYKAYPTRFAGLAMLPMNAPDLALAELDRIVGRPGICGIYMGTRIGDLELSDPSLFPVYEAIEDVGFAVFLHPIRVMEPQRLRKFYLTNLIGNPTETVVAASHLMFGGVLDRFPDLTFCLPHAGGSLPYLIGRITHGWKVRPECRHLDNPPDTYLRRFHYDTISHSHAALEHLVSLVGADRVVMGSDFCFDMSCRRPVEFVGRSAGLTEAEKSLILSGNARRLLAM